MENQHRKITGYRELSQAEIDLMNRIKAKGNELMALHAELLVRLNSDLGEKGQARGLNAETTAEFERFIEADPLRWAAIGKTNIQTGIMALVRAVAQPTGV